MSYKSVPTTEILATYVNEAVTRESADQKRLRAQTEKMPNAELQISPDQAALLAFLVRLINAKKALEVGTFMGYSALAVAAALPEDGELHACDVSEEWTSKGREFWRQAGVEHKITLRLAPAVQTLAALLKDGHAGTFDFAFIDADKEPYDAYYEYALELLRPGGLMVFDNMLRGGKVADLNHHDRSTDIIRALNAKITADGRVDSAFITIADGFMLARKR